MHRERLAQVWAPVLIGLIAACGIALYMHFGSRSAGCQKDTDCKGDRICQMGACVSAGIGMTQSGHAAVLTVPTPSPPPPKPVPVLLPAAPVPPPTVVAHGPITMPCVDHKRSGVESDVDCGGGLCQKCGPKKKCHVSTDCISGNCKDHVCD